MPRSRAGPTSRTPGLGAAMSPMRTAIARRQPTPIFAPIMLAPDDAAARNNLAELLLDAGCLDESRKQIERAAALAEGTALAPSVTDSRERIDATAEKVARCQLGDRAWPD